MRGRARASGYIKAKLAFAARQQQGVTGQPGLYFLGLHFLHKRKSGLFLGVGEDAEHVAGHIAGRS